MSKQKVDFFVHYQFCWSCPYCGVDHVEDSGEMGPIEGEEVTCSDCEKEFELGEGADG